MPLSKEAVEQLKAVKKYILKVPKRFFMLDITRVKGKDQYPSPSRYPSCGTIGCFAGWICVLNGIEPERATSGQAQRFLGLDLGQADRLFFKTPMGWSDTKSNILWSGDGSRKTAKVAGERIDLFIKSDGEI